MKNYINGNNYNARAGRILASICGFLSMPENFASHAFETFFTLVYENLFRFKESKNYSHFLTDERGDIEVSWHLQLLAELTKTDGLTLLPHMSKIQQLISWYRSTVNKEAIGYISSCYRNISVCLSTIYPMEQCSVDYNISYDNEKEFFTKHLPIRDWASTGDIFNLNLRYHIPNVQEIQVALDFVNLGLKESIQFLTESILSTKNSDSLTSSSKEERNRVKLYKSFSLRLVSIA